MHWRKFLAQIVGVTATLAAAAGLVSVRKSSAVSPPLAEKGPLGIHPRSPRYFTDASGQALHLAGAHMRADLQDSGPAPLSRFDWTEYLQMFTAHNHSFIRLWFWEQAVLASWTMDEILLHRFG